jgi:hypothetical protein
MVFGDALRFGFLPGLELSVGAKRVNIHASAHRDNSFLKTGIVGIIIRRGRTTCAPTAAAFLPGETGRAKRIGFNALKRQEAAKPAVSLGLQINDLCRPKRSPRFRFVSLTLRLTSLCFAQARP